MGISDKEGLNSILPEINKTEEDAKLRINQNIIECNKVVWTLT